MHKNKHLVFLIILFVAGLFIGCDKDETGDNEASLRIKLTDATSPIIKEMIIEITGVDVFVMDSTGVDGEWQSLEFNGGKYDLLKLRNGKMVQLVDQYFPADKKIEKIRLMFGNDNKIVQVVGRDDIPLQKSEEIMDGLEIEDISGVELHRNVITSIVIDINAALSVKEENGNYFLHPAGRAFAETFGGSIEGYVAPIEANPLVALTQNEDTLMTLPEEDGKFLFIGMNPGVWKVHILADKNTTFRDTIFLSDTLKLGQKMVLQPKPIRLAFYESDGE